MHRKVVLQLPVHRGEIIVHPHIRQRGHIRGRDGAEVESDVVVQRADMGQGEGRVHKRVRGHLRLVVAVLRNRPGEGINPRDFLHRPFCRWTDPLKTVFCNKITTTTTLAGGKG